MAARREAINIKGTRIAPYGPDTRSIEHVAADLLSAYATVAKASGEIIGQHAIPAPVYSGPYNPEVISHEVLIVEYPDPAAEQPEPVVPPEYEI